MYSILKEQGLADEYAPEHLLQQLSYLKSLGLDLEELKAEGAREKELHSVFQLYEHQKRLQNLVDFDDLLLDTRDLLRNQTGRREALQKQLKYLLIDEAQDLNPVQLEILKLLYKPGCTELFLVADPNQSIYSFRGATPGFLYQIQDYFKDIQTSELTVNYRNPAPVVDLALQVSERLVNMTPHQKEGPLPVLFAPDDPAQEAKEITQLIQEKQAVGQPFSEFCVLSRTSEHLMHTFEELVLAGIPCHIASSRCLVYEKPFIRPLLDNLRLAIDPANRQALLGMLRTLYLKKDLVEEINNGRVQNFLLEELSSLPDLGVRQKKAVRTRMDLLSSIKDLAPGDAIRACRESFFDRYNENGYRYLLSSAREQALETLDELESKAGRFNSLEEYLAFIDLVIQRYKEKPDSSQDRVSILTIHGAKGLEFNSVFVAGAIENLLPHQNAIEDESPRPFQIQSEEDPLQEESRLLYVAITRSIQELYLSAPRQHKDRPAELSRFLVNTRIQRGDAMAKQ